MIKFYILGEDSRTQKLKEMYEIENMVTENASLATHIIVPIPFSKDAEHITGTAMLIKDFAKMCINKYIISGAISKAHRRVLEINNVEYLDLMELDEMAILNAIPTAEGTVMEVIKETDITIFGSNLLILGYGRLGRVVAKTFGGLGAKIYCEARSKKDLALIYSMGYNEVDLKKLNNYLDKMDIIINTVPTMMLDEKRLALLKKDCIVIDISSKPGGVDFEAAMKLGIKAKLLLGIPSIVAPKTAAMYMKQIIDKYI